MRFAREQMPGGHAANLLEHRACEGGASTRTGWEARARWTRLAREDVQAWTEARASDAAWERARQALEGLAHHMPRGLTLARWAVVVGDGARLARKIEAASHWVAIEACKHLGAGALEGAPDTWMVEVVRHYAIEMGRAEAIDDRTTREALAHWRWPQMRPPLRVIAARAGIDAPIRGDDAWRRALVDEVEADRAGTRADAAAWLQAWIDGLTEGE